MRECESSPISSPCSSPMFCLVFEGLLSFSQVKVALLKNRALAALKLNSWQEATQIPSQQMDETSRGQSSKTPRFLGRLITWIFCVQTRFTCFVFFCKELQLKDAVFGYRTCYIGTGHGPCVSPCTFPLQNEGTCVS